MPQNKQREHKCSHHTAAAGGGSRWRSFHFSGKVIMCSVLFGLGLVLIGGIVMAIGMDRDDGSNSKVVDMNEIQNKAPMSIVGPVILGIGGFTVIVGIIMCLFETNICRKRKQPDARPLIEEQGANSAASGSDTAAVPSTTQGRDKYRHHKNSSLPRKHKCTKKRSQPEDKAKSEISSFASRSSKPIDMQKSSSREFTASDKFLTPPSSFVNDNVPLKPNYSNAENQTSASLLKSFTSSGKSWTTSTEFQTPSSSLRDSSGSFEERKKNIEASPPLSNSEEFNKKPSSDLKPEFLSPKSSYAEILDDESGSESITITESTDLLEKSEDDLSGKSLDEPIQKNLDLLQHEFITPKNSYVDKVKNSSEIDQVLDTSSISTLTNSQSQEDIDENISPKKSPITFNEPDEIKIENTIINNHDLVENLNGEPPVLTAGAASLTTNSELNSYAPIKDNMLETSEVPLNQPPTNTTSEIADNVHTKIVTSQELNTDVQESNNHPLEDKKESDIKFELKDSSSNDTTITSLQ